MKKGILIFVVLASILFVTDYVPADNDYYSDLVGRKWTGTRIVTFPNRMVIKAHLEITNLTDGQVEGFYKMDVDGNPQVLNFKSPVNQSADGLGTIHERIRVCGVWLRTAKGRETQYCKN